MNKKGFSLIEILVAASIMVAAMVPLWGLLGSSHRQVTVSVDEVRVSQIANEIIEQIENSVWFPDPGEISFTPVSDGALRLGGAAGLDIAFSEFPEYFALQGRLTMEKYPSGSDKGRILSLDLAYKSRENVGKDNKSYKLSTFIARK